MRLTKPQSYFKRFNWATVTYARNKFFFTPSIFSGMYHIGHSACGPTTVPCMTSI